MRTASRHFAAAVLVLTTAAAVRAQDVSQEYHDAASSLARWTWAIDASVFFGFNGSSRTT